MATQQVDHRQAVRAVELAGQGIELGRELSSCAAVAAGPAEADDGAGETVIGDNVKLVAS
jgi:hypothetical protein